METKRQEQRSKKNEQAGSLSRFAAGGAIRALEGEGNERRFRLSFSSEEPYERWWGTEILSHNEGAADLTRLNSIGVVLFNHDRDKVIGKITRAWIENGRGEAEIEFDTDEAAQTVYEKVESGTLRGVSVGYTVEVWEEVAELKHDKPKDVKRPTRKLHTYGRQFTLTREAFINDDIDLVTRIPAKYAASARKTLNKQAYESLINNPAIYDGTELFSAAHGNLITAGTGITQSSMQAMILALQNQTDEFGEAIIVRPAKIIVPAGMAFDIYTLFNSPTINTEGNTQAVNPLYRYANAIQVIEDPTINVLCGGFGNVMPWFLLGAKSRPKGGYKGNVKRANRAKVLQYGTITRSGRFTSTADPHKAFTVKLDSGHITVAQREPGSQRKSGARKSHPNGEEALKVLYAPSIPNMLGYEKGVYGVVEPQIYSALQKNIQAQIEKVL